MMNTFSHNIHSRYRISIFHVHSKYLLAYHFLIRELQDMINARDADEKTPLHLAMNYGMLSRVKTLLKFHAGKAMHIHISQGFFFLRV